MTKTVMHHRPRESARFFKKNTFSKFLHWAMHHLFALQCIRLLVWRCTLGNTWKFIKPPQYGLNRESYPVTKSILLDGIEQRLFFPASPSSLCFGTPERKAPAVNLLIGMPSSMVADFGTRGEALRAKFNILTFGTANPQIRNICQAVHTVLLP